MKSMHRERISCTTRVFLISVFFLIGCFLLLALPASAESQPYPSATTTDIQSLTSTSPDFLQNLISAFRSLIAGIIPGNKGSQAPTATPGKENGNPAPLYLPAIRK